jgi:lysine 2,3-aminomutase
VVVLKKKNGKADSIETAGSTSWQKLMAGSIQSVAQLASHLPVDQQDIETVAGRYAFRINPYYLSLIKEKDGPLWKQAVPDVREIRRVGGMVDPLSEEKQSPVPNLIHRYPDRVVFLISDQCAMYCRHCMRKRKVGETHLDGSLPVSHETIDQGLAYIRSHQAIRDVLLSGGDPLMRSDQRIEDILVALKGMAHVEMIRIHTRLPCTLPQRITPALSRMLGRFHPLYVNIQFNHPHEITPEAARACALLADAGIPMGCQTVLLQGINDDPAIMMQLMRKLLTIRVKPYYIHHADLVEGTMHFRTSIKRGLEIMAALRGFMSGMGVPQYMIDLPQGGGKIPLLPPYIVHMGNDRMVVRNYEGKRFEYPLNES